MPDPFKALVTSLENRFGGLAAKAVSGLPAELGTMTEAGLKLDSFKVEIPDYELAEWLVKLHVPAFSWIGTSTSPVAEDGTALPEAATTPRTRFDFEETEIADVRLNWREGVKPGDRVLAVPVEGGQRAVVVCKVVSAGG